MSNTQIKNEESIKQWLIVNLASLLEVESSDIEINVPFDRYGLDSSAAVELTGDLGEWLGAELEPTLLYDYSTISALSAYLAEEVAIVAA